MALKFGKSHISLSSKDYTSPFTKWGHFSLTFVWCSRYREYMFQTDAPFKVIYSTDLATWKCNHLVCKISCICCRYFSVRPRSHRHVPKSRRREINQKFFNARHGAPQAHLCVFLQSCFSRRFWSDVMCLCVFGAKEGLSQNCWVFFMLQLEHSVFIWCEYYHLWCLKSLYIWFQP